MGEIRIKKPVYSNQKLQSKADISQDLEKYLKNKTLFIEYDHEITKEESILNIPLTATLLPLAWLTGANIYVEKLEGFAAATAARRK